MGARSWTIEALGALIVPSSGHPGKLSLRDMDGSGDDLKRSLALMFEAGEHVLIVRRDELEQLAKALNGEVLT